MVRVLIVDDSATMRKILVRGLRQAQLDVGTTREARDGGDGLVQLQSQRADLVLLDLEMPDMTGDQFVQSVVDRIADPPPIVMIAGSGREPAIRAALASGASGYIDKPFTPDRLHEVLARYLKEP